MSDPTMVTVGDLRTRCEILRDTLLANGVDEPELDRHAPGGRDNQAPPHEDAAAWKDHAQAWLYHYMQLHRRHATIVAREQGTAADDEVAEALADAAAEVPVLVPFEDGETRAVYPKGLHALRWLDSLDRQMVRARQVAEEAATIIDRVEAHGEVATAERQLLVLEPLVESLAVRLWLWILTSKGNELPFDDAAIDLEPPTWTKAATPTDVVNVFRAHVEVNQRRLAIIAQAFPADSATSAKSRLPLAGFVSALANEQGRDLRELQRRTSLGAVYAGAIAAAQQAREAHAHAERERAARSQHRGV